MRRNLVFCPWIEATYQHAVTVKAAKQRWRLGFSSSISAVAFEIHINLAWQGIVAAFNRLNTLQVGNSIDEDQPYGDSSRKGLLRTNSRRKYETIPSV